MPKALPEEACKGGELVEVVRIASLASALLVAGPQAPQDERAALDKLLCQRWALVKRKARPEQGQAKVGVSEDYPLESIIP